MNHTTLSTSVTVAWIMSLFLLGYHASFTMVGAWAFIVTAFVIFIVVYRDRKEEEKPKP